jgi:hypothetical protein
LDCGAGLDELKVELSPPQDASTMAVSTARKKDLIGMLSVARKTLKTGSSNVNTAR